MPIRVALSAALIAAGIVSASAEVRAGQGARLKEQAIACPTMKGLLSLMRTTDQWKASMQALEEKCVVIDKDEMVRVSQEPGAFTCFTTQKHRGDCLWVPSDYIVPID